MNKKGNAGDCMDKLKLAYCNECEDLVEYQISDEKVTERYKGEEVQFRFKVGRCKCCGGEVATDAEYNYRKSEEKIKAYKKLKGIISLDEISEILVKYNIGKEALAEIAGFGKVTVKRYYEGVIPSIEYSDILKRILNDEAFFEELVEKNKDKLSDVSYNKIIMQYKVLTEIGKSKIMQITNYIITHLGEVTPLALEKLLAFSNGVNYAVNGRRMIFEPCEPWQHGPVYPIIYTKYKKYGYKPIDDGINSEHGCMLSCVPQCEIDVLNMVLKTFGLYSPKILEMISHMQTPWAEKRINCDKNKPCHEAIDEDSVKDYYIKNKLNSEENIMEYILKSIKKWETEDDFQCLMSNNQ